MVFWRWLPKANVPCCGVSREEFKKQIREFTDEKDNSKVDLEGLIGRDTITPGSLSFNPNLKDENELLRVLQHLRKYASAKPVHYNIGRAFQIWKCK